MLKNIFSSQTRIDLLKQLLLCSDKEFYLRELVEITQNFPHSIRMELKNLESIDLVLKRISGKQHYYKANRKHPLYEELHNILLKTVGFVDILIKYLEPFKKKIEFAFVYGSMAKGSYTSSSDVDLMIVGDVSPREIASACVNIGNELKRELNYSVFPLAEIVQKINIEDHFFTSIKHEPLLFIFGDKNEFEGLGS